MPELVDQMYCSQQIVIPPRYPYILKRYCKAAIKTQPYDLLRWSFEYFRALAENRSPPVKLRLEYPVFCTEGGLTRGCLKVLANQLLGIKDVPLPVIKRSWAGFCLDSKELTRILCLCEVYTREESVPFLHFIAVAGGQLTKCLTHTMILLCETLTKEPDGGAGSIPSSDFLTMYEWLARMDCSKDCLYVKGYREGTSEEEIEKEIESELESVEDEINKTLDPVDQDDNKSVHSKTSSAPVVSDNDDFWGDSDLQKLSLIDDKVARSNRLSIKLSMPINQYFERSPSVERASKIERENFMMDRKGGKPTSNVEVDNILRNMSLQKAGGKDAPPSPSVSDTTSHSTTTHRGGDHDNALFYGGVDIHVYDEDDAEQPVIIDGELSKEKLTDEGVEDETTEDKKVETVEPEEGEVEGEQAEVYVDEAQRVADLVANVINMKRKKIEDMKKTFDEIAEIVSKFNSANYDLGMVAGRQMSTTSGEFIVQHIEREIMDYINEQIAVLPDPDLKKKKAKPEEVKMIHEIIEQYLDEHMADIVMEVEEVEEEEEPIPEMVQVYAVPGIGPPVDAETIEMFEDFIRDLCKTQGDMVMPRNIRHFLCPPLEKYEEHAYDAMS